ncbi:MAG: NAD(P)H-hydrate dehydratase [Desulfatitalea sp.]|nr:NAD(P)H-hydrate dehydratase [Desulfatitalea sp.]NNK00662.1 NAD(P)H-hydrate dehydratase [Desulfatitalea sp.]
MHIVSAAEMQAMDQKTIETYGIPGRVLMENAGRGATRTFLKRIYTAGAGKVGVIAGRGNNGGDGFVIARYLAQRGIDTEVYLLSARDKVKGDAAANLDLLPSIHVPIVEIPDQAAFAARQPAMQQPAYWVDAIFGTGLNAAVKGYFKTVIDLINDAMRPVLAVDIPSGLQADTGQPCGACIRARATATFGAAKIGHVTYPGAHWCGTVDVIDIGIPSTVVQEVNPCRTLITGSQVRTMLPARAADSHKGRSGHILVVAGSTGKTGAAAMAAMAALRAGAGLVTLAVPKTLNPSLSSQTIEAMTLPMPDDGHGHFAPSAFDPIRQALADKQCLAIGPGMGTSCAAADLTRRLIEACPLPMVIDADGLNHLVGHLDLLTKRRSPVILTPHPGEMARLAGCTVQAVQKDRIAAVRRMAVHFGACVILKGARTVIGDPKGRIWINPTGNAGMASGGMGDVLTGAVAGFLAQGCTDATAAICAVYLHGLAADLLAEKAPYGYLATEVMDALPQAIQTVLDDPPPAIVNGPLL